LASAEWRSADNDVTEYRKHSPSNPPVQPMVPRASAKRVYDIKYFERDSRREKMLVGGGNKKFDERTVVDASQIKAEGSYVKPPPRSSTSVFDRERKNLLDYPGDGYQ